MRGDSAVEQKQVAFGLDFLHIVDAFAEDVSESTEILLYQAYHVQ